MKRVLVISDNARLLTSLMQMIGEQKLDSIATFGYRYSINNKAPDAMLGLGCAPIDVKDEGTVERILVDVDLVLSIHCKQIFPPSLVSRVPCYNLHPGLNPHNRGWYPQVFSIINGRPAGATLHRMSEDVDAGPIVDQEEVPLRFSDTSLSAYARVQDAEIGLLRRSLKPLLLGEPRDLPLPPPGNYNSIDDFRKICDLDLAAVGTLAQHIDLLRALTHGDFNNAFFRDESGNKVFVRIHLSPDDGA